MIELASLLGGALVRLMTWGSEYFTKKQENSHELVLLEKQLELAKVQAASKAEELRIQGETQLDVTWGEALNTALASTSTSTGNCYIDTLNSIVRPFLTFWWCIVLYSVYKGFLIYAAVTDALSAKEMANVVATDFDRSVVGSIIGFWFADRAIRKFSYK